MSLLLLVLSGYVKVPVPTEVNAVDGEFPFIETFESIEAAEQGRFSAAGGADEDRKLVLLDGEIDSTKDGISLKRLL
jgi:hypothetical protein